MEVRRYDTADTSLRGLLAALYARVYDGDPVKDTDAFTGRLARQCELPGWVCAVGFADGLAVGYAYGHPLPAGTDWWARTAPHRAGEDALEDGARSFTLAEIGVLARWRKTGTARQLHDAVLTDRPEHRAVLRVLASRPRLIAVYRAWGYTTADDTPSEARAHAMVLPLR